MYNQHFYPMYKLICKHNSRQDFVTKRNNITPKLSLLLVIIIACFCSCIVESPKYTTLDKVLNLKVGMTKNQVEKILNLEPYLLKFKNDSCIEYIYIYRVKTRNTFSFNTKPTNGRVLIGNYVQLGITYSLNDSITKIESCITCPDNLVKTSKIDYDKIIIFVTVTLPVILIYIGVKQ